MIKVPAFLLKRLYIKGSLRNNLANGNYSALATSLYTLNYSRASGLNATLPDIPAGMTLREYRHSRPGHIAWWRRMLRRRG